MKPFSRSHVFKKMFWQRIIPPLLMIPILIINACSSTPASLTSNPTDLATHTSTKTPELSNTTAIEPTLFPSLTPTPTLTLIPTPTPTLAPTRPLLPAPIVPDVSSVISVENANLLTRLTSLGEGDLLNMQLSPDGSQIILGTSNGILVLDSSTLEKIRFLPTSMSAKEISFIEGGTKLTATDRNQGYVWSFPEGKEIRHVQFPCLEILESNNYCNLVPSHDFKYVFAHAYHTRDRWSLSSYSDAIAGLLRTSDGSTSYMVDYNVKVFSSSPDNQLLAISTGDKLVLTEYYEGNVLHEESKAGIEAFYFSPGGNILAAVSSSDISFWSIPDLTLINTISAYKTRYLRFSPDYSTIAILSDDAIRLLRASDQRLINVFSGVSITFTHESRGFTVDNGKGIVNYFLLNPDLSNAELNKSFIGKGIREDWNRWGNAGIFSNDDKKLLLVQTKDINFNEILEKIIVYDFNTGVRQEVSNDTWIEYNDINAVWIEDLQSFGMRLCKDYVCHISIFGDETESLKNYLTDWVGGHTLEFSNNSELLVLEQFYNHSLLIWDIKNNGYWPLSMDQQDNKLVNNNYSRIVFSPDDTVFYYYSNFSKYYLIDAQNYSILSIDEAERNISLRSNFIGKTNGWEAVIYDKDTNKEIVRITDDNTDVDFNFDKKLLATVSNDGLNVWEYSDLQQVKLIFNKKIAHGNYNQVSFSPDGRFIAALDGENPYDIKVNIWNSIDGSLVYRLGGGYWHKDFAFSPDSNMIAVSSDSPVSFSIFNLLTGEIIFSSVNYLCGGAGPSLAFSPDGKYLAVLCSNTYPQIWGIPITEEPVITDRVE